MEKRKLANWETLQRRKQLAYALKFKRGEEPKRAKHKHKEETIERMTSDSANSEIEDFEVKCDDPLEYDTDLVEKNADPPEDNNIILITLQTIISRIDEMENNFNAKIDELDHNLNARIDALEMNLSSRLDALQQTFSDHVENEHDQKKLIQENLNTTKEIYKGLQSIADDEQGDEIDDEIARLLPIKTFENMSALEEKLNDLNYSSKFKLRLLLLKSRSAELDYVFKNIIADSLLVNYNYDGRCGKKSLRGLKIFDQFLFDTFAEMGRLTYERSIRKSVDLGHNRIKSKIKRSRTYEMSPASNNS